jgi:hypothetical protein
MEPTTAVSVMKKQVMKACRHELMHSILSARAAMKKMALVR